MTSTQELYRLTACAMALGNLRARKEAGEQVLEGKLAVAERQLLASAIDYYWSRQKDHGVIGQ